MSSKYARFVIFASKIQKQHIQLFFVLLTLVMLVIGAGAPEDVGTIGH